MLGQRLAAVDARRLAGAKGAGHGEQDGTGDVVDGSDPPDRIEGADVGEVVRLALLGEGVPASASTTPGEMTNDPPFLIRGAKCLASISGPITLVSNDSRTASRSRSAIRPRASR